MQELDTDILLQTMQETERTVNCWNCVAGIHPPTKIRSDIYLFIV